LETDQPQQTDSATSLRQRYLTPLNLIAAETSRRLANWANNGQPADDRNPQVRAITWID
jgi:hypothetical protein